MGTESLLWLRRGQSPGASAGVPAGGGRHSGLSRCHSKPFEGHPGFLHGGIIATLLDETMSKAVRARGLTAMTRHMEVDYKRPVPSCVQIRMEGRIVKDEGRKHWVEATIFGRRGHALPAAKDCYRGAPAEARLNRGGAAFHFSVEATR